MSFLNPDRPAIILAPMEGVTDAPFREFITRTGFYDYCVSEFIRVSSHPLPPKVFRNEVPELRNESKTPAGIPVQVQILGGHPERMALSALAAIDGFDDPAAIDENVKRAEQGGAAWITIHGRTKTQGYTPPAYWKPIGKAARGVSIPVVANGELWSSEDLRRCQEETGSKHFMIGRGALAVPGFALQAREALGLPMLDLKNPLSIPKSPEPGAWSAFFGEYSSVQPSPSRLKQLARYLHTKGSIHWWDQVKTMGSTEEILRFLASTDIDHC